MNDTIQDVLTAEAEAQKIIANADKEAENLVLKARRDAVTAAEKVSKDSTAKRDAAITEAESEIEKERSAILAQSKKQITSLDKKVTKNIDNAVDYVMKTFKAATK